MTLKQGYSNLAREIHFPAEFSSNPNQTHLSMLINVFRIIRKSQVGEFDQGLELNSAGSGSREPDLSIPALKSLLCQISTSGGPLQTVNGSIV